MAITRTRRHRPRVEIINMVDVMFFLLAFFMVFTTFRTTPASLNVDLPKAATAARETPTNLVVTVRETGSIFLDGRSVTLSQLSVLVGDAVRRHPDQFVVVRADKDVRYERVVQVVDVVRQVGAYRLGLAVELVPASSQAGP